MAKCNHTSSILLLESDMVIFQDIPKYYPADKDIFAVYKLKKKFHPNGDDWIGVFPSNWTKLEEFVARQQVPRSSRRAKKIYQKAIVLPVNTIKADKDNTYQFVYVTKGNKIMGLSSMFGLCEEADKDKDVSLDTMTVQHNEPHQDLLKAEDTTCTVFGPMLPEDTKMPVFGPMLPEDTKMPVFGPMLPEDTKMPVFGRMLPEDLLMPMFGPNHDHVTLASDFTVTPSGTALLNNLELVIDPEIKRYLENSERSLLAVDPADRAVVPYDNLITSWFDPQPLTMVCQQHLSKDDIWLAALADILSNPACPHPNSPVSVPTTPRPQQHPHNTCQLCRKSQRSLKIVKDKLKTCKKLKHKLMKELEDFKDIVSTKDLLQEQLSDQTMYLVHENNQLTTVNDKLQQQQQDMSNRLMDLEHHLPSLRAALKAEKYTNKSKQDEIVLLTGQIGNVETMMKMSDNEKEIQKQHTAFLENEMADVQNKYSALESHLDDIMYTLCILGYTRMVDINGNVTDLTKKTGSRLELHGWAISSNKREEFNMKQLANQKEEISRLQTEWAGLRDELEAKTQELDDVYTNIEISDIEDNQQSVTQQVTQLLEDLNTAAEKEATLYHLLVNERRINALLQHKYNKSVENLYQSEVVKKTVCTNTSPSYKKNASTNTGMSGSNTQSSVNVDLPHTNHRQWKQTYSSDTRISAHHSATASKQSNADQQSMSVNPSVNKQVSASLTDNIYKENKDQAVAENRSQKAVRQGSEVFHKDVLLQPNQQISPQDSSIFRNNVLQRLFRQSQSDIELSPQGSQCLLGRVLSKLFKETPAPDESGIGGSTPGQSGIPGSATGQPGIRGSSCLVGNVLPNLFNDNRKQEKCVGYPPYNLATMLMLQHQLSDGYLAHLDGNVLPHLFLDNQDEDMNTMATDNTIGSGPTPSDNDLNNATADINNNVSPNTTAPNEHSAGMATQSTSHTEKKRSKPQRKPRKFVYSSWSNNKRGNKKNKN